MTRRPQRLREMLADPQVIELPADLHQPLHVSDDGDKGGNLVHVLYQNQPTNLHAMWDDVCVREMLPEIKLHVQSKANLYSQTNITTGSVVDWANEGFMVAKKIYTPSMRVPPDTGISLQPSYCAQQEAIISQQLQKAGLRLASILNDVFRTRAAPNL
jgi:hypothetical protein